MSKTFIKLSRAAMRQLAVGQKIHEHGITFERTANGDGVFVVNVMVDGQRIHRVVGRESDGTTRTQAEQYLAKVRGDAKSDRLALPKGRKVALTMNEAAGKYLKRLEESGGKDLKMKRQRLALHLIPFFGSMPLNRISSFDVHRYKAQRLKEPVLLKPRGRTVKKVSGEMACVKPATVNRELAVLSHLFTKAVEWGWVDTKPAKIERLKEGSGRIVYLTVDQAQKLVECAKADGNAQIYAFILIALETSMRRSEILSIKREHIDFARRVIHIPKAKAGAREQPITRHLVDFLHGTVQGLPPGSPWLFPSATAKEGHTTDIRKVFRRVVAAAGLDPDVVVRHTLRHTAITHLVQAGVDLPTVQRISGHKTLQMVVRYSHQNGEHIQAAMDKLEERYHKAA